MIERRWSKRRVFIVSAIGVGLLLLTSSTLTYLNHDKAAAARKVARQYMAETDPRKRAGLWEELVEMGTDAIPGYLLLFEEGKPSLQAKTAELLGSVKSEEVAELLLGRLNSSHEAVRVQCLDAIARQDAAVPLEPLVRLYRTAQTLAEKSTAASALGSVYNRSRPRPREVFDMLWQGLRDSKTLMETEAALNGLSCSVMKREADDYELAALPDVFKVFLKEPAIALPGYGTIAAFTGRDFTGISHDVGDAGPNLTEGTRRLILLNHDEELRKQVVEEARQWMEKRRAATP